MPSLSIVEEADAALVHRVLQGDDAAFALLVDRHKDRLVRYATHLLGDQAEAEDAVQDALFRGYRFLGQCQNPARVGAWFLTILVNRCRTVRIRWRNSRERLVADFETVDHPAGGPDLPDWSDEINRALGSLTLDQREAFLLKHVEDLSYEEMTAVTGASVPALKMRVKRACEHLRNILEDHHG